MREERQFVLGLDTFALAGGLGAELVGGTVSSEAFQRRALDFLRLSDVIPATLRLRRSSTRCAAMRS